MAGVQYPSDVAAGTELGQVVGAQVVDWARRDGSDAQWTGSVPTEPGHWNGTNPILPLAGTWKTWALASGSELRPGAPPTADSPPKTTPAGGFSSQPLAVRWSQAEQHKKPKRCKLQKEGAACP
jgi:hypothetical protein